MHNRYIINCGGKYADKIADMADARTGWNLMFYRSQALILDKKLAGTINNIVGIPPEAGVQRAQVPGLPTLRFDVSASSGEIEFQD